jgi:hypothetical protein
MADLQTTHGLPVHDDGHEFRVLGALPPSALCALPPFSAAYEELPESQWQPTSAKKWKFKIWDQKQYSSCVGQASAAAFTYAWQVSGQPYYEFSPTSVYAYINGGRDAGARVADGLETMKTNGLCLMSQFGQDQLYPQQIPAAARQMALRFRVVEAYKINNWRQLCTALSRGLIGVTGIAVGNNFSNLDRNGVAPLPDRVIGGHALVLPGLDTFNGAWFPEAQNSWTERWGRNGFCYLQQDAWHPSFGFPFDTFVIGGVFDDPVDTANDPLILV